MRQEERGQEGGQEGEPSADRLVVLTASEPPVWVIGSDQWPRAYLRAELIERGYDATGFVTMKDAVGALALGRVPRPVLIVWDLHGQDLDANLTAAVFRQGVAVVGVTGLRESTDEAVRALPWAQVLRRPVTIGAVADAVDRLVGSPAARARYWQTV